MLVIQKLHASPAAPVDAELLLPYELRQKSRLRTHTIAGEEAGLFLPQGHVMRDGELLEADDGRIVRVVAQAERLLQVRCASERDLVRAAYHLGNRHVALQIGDGFLRLPEDTVLRQMLAQLGAEVIDIEAPFDPEPGAYGGQHQHGEERGHRGIIHQFGDQVGKDST